MCTTTKKPSIKIYKFNFLNCSISYQQKNNYAVQIVIPQTSSNKKASTVRTKKTFAEQKRTLNLQEINTKKFT